MVNAVNMANTPIKSVLPIPKCDRERVKATSVSRDRTTVGT